MNIVTDANFQKKLRAHLYELSLGGSYDSYVVILLHIDTCKSYKELATKCNLSYRHCCQLMRYLERRLLSAVKREKIQLTRSKEYAVESKLIKKDYATSRLVIEDYCEYLSASYPVPGLSLPLRKVRQMLSQEQLRRQHDMDYVIGPNTQRIVHCILECASMREVSSRSGYTVHQCNRYSKEMVEIICYFYKDHPDLSSYITFVSREKRLPYKNRQELITMYFEMLLHNQETSDA